MRLNYSLMLILSGLTILLLAGNATAREPESYYQQIFCAGKTEHRLHDNSRVDCLTNEYAIEVDFAYKWAESIGQSLLYAKMTNRKPAVLLIVNDRSAPHLTRFHNASDGLGIILFTIPE